MEKRGKRRQTQFTGRPGQYDIGPGTEFYRTLPHSGGELDKRTRWRVARGRADGLWDCQVVSPDWNGTGQTFTDDDIRRSLRQQKGTDLMEWENDQWWESRKLGSLVHFHAGFGAFVRGEVAVNPRGQKYMHCIALVGVWDERELPYRRPTGEMEYPYHAALVLGKHAHAADFRPYCRNVWECPNFSKHLEGIPQKKSFTPHKLQPVDLSPDPTDDDLELRLQLRDWLVKILMEGSTAVPGCPPPPVTLESLKETFRVVHGMLDSPGMLD